MVVWLEPSCCGTLGVTGLNRSDLDRFKALERQCSTGGRRCGCAPGPTILDDGTRLDRAGPVRVACRQQLCKTFLGPPPAPVCDCAPGEYCLQVMSGVRPRPGESGVTATCQPLPRACQQDASCACLRTLGGACAVGPTGMLSLTLAAP